MDAKNVNLPTFQDWLDDRNVAEEVAYPAEYNGTLEERLLPPFLKSNGLETPALTFLRSHVSLSLMRRKAPDDHGHWRQV